MTFYYNRIDYEFPENEIASIDDISDHRAIAKKFGELAYVTQENFITQQNKLASSAYLFKGVIVDTTTGVKLSFYSFFESLDDCNAFNSVRKEIFAANRDLRGYEFISESTGPTECTQEEMHNIIIRFTPTKALFV